MSDEIWSLELGIGPLVATAIHDGTFLIGLDIVGDKLMVRG